MRWTAAQLEAYQARRNAPPAPPARPRRANATRAAAAVAVLPEDAVHVAVVEHLKARCRPGIHWHHPATGEIRDPGTANKLKRFGVKAGLPDLLLLIEGRLHALELKRERGGRVSADQTAMHAELLAAGAVVAVARGLDQALSTLTAWGVFGPVNAKGLPA